MPAWVRVGRWIRDCPQHKHSYDAVVVTGRAGVPRSAPSRREVMRGASLAAASLLSLWLMGCEPWGKPVAPQKVAADFQTLFRDSCSGCHGAEGRGGPGRILNDALYLAFIPKESLR